MAKKQDTAVPYAANNETAGHPLMDQSVKSKREVLRESPMIVSALYYYKRQSY